MEFLRMRVNVSGISTLAALLAAPALLLAACGGGGDDDGGETATPTSTPTTSAGEPIPTATPFAVTPTPTIVASTATPTPTGTAAPPAPSGGSATAYTVEEGDSLFGIAARFNTSVEAIIEANGITDRALIFAGQELTIPAPAEGEAAAPAPAPEGSTTYTIEEGDSLFAIAAWFGASVEAILEANQIANPSLIFAGLELVIPAP